MAIQSEETSVLRARVFNRMFKDDNRAIVEVIAVNRKRVNRALERRANFNAGFDKEIHAEMNGAAFIGGPVAGCELRRIVESASFVVAADSNSRTAAPHLRKNCIACSGHLRTGGVGSQKCAAYTEIENMQRRGAKINTGKLQHRAPLFRPSFQFAPQGRGLRPRLQSTRRTKCIVREARVNPGKSFQRIPRRSFAHSDISVVWLERFAIRRVDHAYC